MTQRFGRPRLVRAGESSTRSKPSTSTKKLIAGSYSLTMTGHQADVHARQPRARSRHDRFERAGSG
jgi:hypothetical protein